LIWFSICFEAPWPIATIAITLAMPITIPSIVRNVRTLLRPSDRMDRKIDARGSRGLLQDLSVPDPDRPLGVVRRSPGCGSPG
jgi:hypothetical protein